MALGNQAKATLEIMAASCVASPSPERVKGRRGHPEPATFGKRCIVALSVSSGTRRSNVATGKRRFLTNEKDKEVAEKEVNAE
jgi:hypothetical protein